MRSPGTDSKVFKRKVKIFDVEKKELLGVFESTFAAAEFARIKQSGISSYIKFKRKCHTNKLNRILAFR